MQRATEKTEDVSARASAVQELQAAGTFEDLIALGPGQDDIDRRLEQLGTKTAVDDESARLKAELGTGHGPATVAGPDRPAQSAEQEPCRESADER